MIELTKCRRCGRIGKVEVDLFGRMWKWTACNTKTTMPNGRPPTLCPVCLKLAPEAQT